MAHDEPPRRPQVVPGEIVRAAVFQPVNDDTVHRVTSAREGLSQEQRARTRRYLIQMFIRTACFVGAVAAHMSNAPGWVTWSFVAGAVVLPYVAVVMVNAGRENDPFLTEAVPPASGTLIVEATQDPTADQSDSPNSRPLPRNGPTDGRSA